MNPASPPGLLPAAMLAGGAVNHRENRLVAVLTEELDSARRKIEELERQKLVHIRDLSQFRLDEEKRRMEAIDAAHKAATEFMAAETSRSEHTVIELRSKVENETKRRRELEVTTNQSRSMQAELHSLVAEKEAELTALRRKLLSAEQASKAREAELGNEVRGLEARIDALTDIADQRANEFEDARDANVESHRATETCKKLLHEATKQCALLERRVAELEAVEHSLRNDIAKATERHKLLASATVDVEKRRASEFDDSEKRIASFDLELQKSRSATQEREIAVLQLTSQLDDQVSLLHDERRLNRRLSEELSDLKRVVAAMEEETRAAQSDNLRLESSLTTQSVRIDALTKQLSSRQDAVESLEAQHLESQQIVRQLREELQRAQLELQRKSQLVGLIESLQDVIRRSSSDASLTERRLLEARTRATQAENQLAALDHIHSTNAELEKGVRAAEERLHATQLRLETLESQNSEYRMTADDAVKQRHEAESSLKVARQRIAELVKLQDELEAAHARQAALEGRLASTQAKSDEMEREMTELAFECNRQRQQIDSSTAELARMKTLEALLTLETERVAEQVAENARIRDEARRTALQCESLANSNQHLEENLRFAREALEEATRKSDRVAVEAAARADAEREVKRAREELVEATRREDQLAARLSHLKMENATLQSRVEQAEFSLEVRAEDIATAKSKIAELQIEVGKKSVAADTAERQMTKLQSRSQETSHEAERLTERINELESQNRALLQQTSSLVKLRDELAQKAEDVAEQLRTAERRAADERNRRVAGDSYAKGIEQELEGARTSVRKSTVLEGQTSTLQRVLAEKEATIQSLQSELDVVQEGLRGAAAAVESRDAMNRRLQDLRQELIQLREELNDAQQENVKLRTVGVERDRALREAQSELTETRETLRGARESDSRHREYISTLEAQAKRCSQLEGQVRGLEDVLKAEQEHVTELRAHLESEKHSVAQRDDELAKYSSARDQTALVQQQLEDTRLIVVSLETEASSRSVLIAKQQTEISELVRQCDEVKSRHHALELRTMDLQNQLHLSDVRLEETETIAEEVERAAVLESIKLHALLQETAVAHEALSMTIAAAQAAEAAARKALTACENRLHETQRALSVAETRTITQEKSIQDLKHSTGVLLKQLEEAKRVQANAESTCFTADAECDAAVETTRRAQRELESKAREHEQAMEALRQQLVDKAQIIHRQTNLIEEIRHKARLDSRQSDREGSILSPPRSDRNLYS
jgi:chromosome segregation ATPase